MQEDGKLPQIEIFLTLSHNQGLYRNIGKAGSQGEHVTKVTVGILRYGYLCNTFVSKASILTI
jgi:hypothetical protein